MGDRRGREGSRRSSGPDPSPLGSLRSRVHPLRSRSSARRSSHGPCRTPGSPKLLPQTQTHLPGRSSAPARSGFRAELPRTRVPGPASTSPSGRSDREHPASRSPTRPRSDPGRDAILHSKTHSTLFAVFDAVAGRRRSRRGVFSTVDAGHLSAQEDRSCTSSARLLRTGLEALRRYGQSQTLPARPRGGADCRSVVPRLRPHSPCMEDRVGWKSQGAVLPGADLVGSHLLGKGAPVYAFRLRLASGPLCRGSSSRRNDHALPRRNRFLQARVRRDSGVFGRAPLALQSRPQTGHLLRRDVVGSSGAALETAFEEAADGRQGESLIRPLLDLPGSERSGRVDSLALAY